MSKAYTQFNALKDRIQKMFTKNEKRRLLIPAATLAEFPSQEDCDEFVRNKLMFNHFDMERPIESYKRTEDGSMLFEQDKEVEQHDA